MKYPYVQYVDVKSSDQVHLSPGAWHVVYNKTRWERWFVDGKYHRLDGPASLSSDGDYAGWYVNGRHYDSNKEYQDAAGLSDEDMAVLVIKYGNIKAHKASK